MFFLYIFIYIFIVLIEYFLSLLLFVTPFFQILKLGIKPLILSLIYSISGISLFIKCTNKIPI